MTGAALITLIGGVSIVAGLARWRMIEHRQALAVIAATMRPASPRDIPGAVPDPGNPGRWIYLADDRAGRRWLVCVDGSPEGGTHQTHRIQVPAAQTDPVTAAAWTYSVSPAVYAGLARRT